MADSIESIVVASVALGAWVLWVLFSDTRQNHGFLVALLAPLALLLLPVLWIAFALMKYSSYLVLACLGRSREHEEFMRKLRARSGLFLLF